MDLERVIKGSPSTFNNHLLILHKLQRGEDPLKVSLIYSPLWVQLYNVPIGFVSENLAIQLGNFIGEFMEYDGSSLGRDSRNFMRIRVKIDVRRPLKKKKQIMCYGKCSYVWFKYERLSLFCFYCGCLGHSDSFCEARMAEGVETKEMRWDLSLRAQSRRAQTMTSVWLREEGEEQGSGINGKRQLRRNTARDLAKNMVNNENIDPILGINLVGSRSQTREVNGKWSGILMNNLMEHDLEDEVFIGEEGKKRNRREMEADLAKVESNISTVRSRRTLEVSNQSSAAAKWQANRGQ